MRISDWSSDVCSSDLEASIPLRTFALEDATADWRALDLDLAADGSSFTVLGPGGVEVRTSVPIPGDFNVANALAAIAAAVEAGHDAETIAAAMSQGTGVPGRLGQEIGREARRERGCQYV